MSKIMSATDAYKRIEALFGKDSIPMAGEVDIIPTGSPWLDYITGIGGIVRGKVIQFAGKEASGKTLLSLIVAAEWQKMNPENCFAFLDAEYTYDYTWAEKLGVDNSRVMLIKNNQAEVLFSGLVGETKVHKTTKKETHHDGILDMIERSNREDEDLIIKYPHPNGVGINNLNLKHMGMIILDSVAAMQPPAERTSAVGKQNIALIARFLSVELRKLTPAVAKANVAMVFINQVRVNPGQMYGNPEDSPGGRALKHACSLMVETARKSGADNIIKNDIDEQVGHKTVAKIDKNKLSSPFKKAEYFVNYFEGIVNKEYELLEVGVKTGVIERPNNRTYIIGESKYTSRDDVLQYIIENEEAAEEMVRLSYLNQNKEGE